MPLGSRAITPRSAGCPTARGCLWLLSCPVPLLEGGEGYGAVGDCALGYCPMGYCPMGYCYALGYHAVGSVLCGCG